MEGSGKSCREIEVEMIKQHLHVGRFYAVVDDEVAGSIDSGKVPFNALL